VIHEVVRANQLLGAEGPDLAGGLNEGLRRAARLATHDWLVVLITDAAGADEETRSLVTRLTAHNDVLTVFVHDPLEADLPDVGRAVFASGGAQIEADTSSPSLSRRFSGEQRDWRESLSAFSRQREIPVLAVSTDRDPADQLRELLGRRKGARSRR